MRSASAEPRWHRRARCRERPPWVCPTDPEVDLTRHHVDDRANLLADEEPPDLGIGRHATLPHWSAGNTERMPRSVALDRAHGDEIAFERARCDAAMSRSLSGARRSWRACPPGTAAAQLDLGQLLLAIDHLWSRNLGIARRASSRWRRTLHEARLSLQAVAPGLDSSS